MARYEGTYSGPHRTRSIGVKLTPDERAALEAAAEEQGAPLSTYVRELCLRRAPIIVARTKRNPQASALLYELNAIGNNLNQLARRANIHGEVREPDELDVAITALKAAIAKVLEL
jgi:uncharacterized protein (DUF1778 family)